MLNHSSKKIIPTLTSLVLTLSFVTLTPRSLLEVVGVINKCSWIWTGQLPIPILKQSLPVLTCIFLYLFLHSTLLSIALYSACVAHSLGWPIAAYYTNLPSMSLSSFLWKYKNLEASIGVVDQTIVKMYLMIH